MAWAAVGCVVAAGFAFATDVDFWPALRMSILFAELVGFTAYISARMIFPLFVALPYGLRLIAEVLTLLSATIFGSVAVAWLQPLFSLAQPRAVALIVLVNAMIAVIVGISLSTYDRMRRQIEESHLQLLEKKAMQRELAIARDVQRGLLPGSLPATPSVELAGVCIPAVGVGGDYYDVLQLGQSDLGLVIADVSGKGIPAALLMACLQASVRALFRPGTNTGELTGRLNESLYRSSSGARYATLFAAHFDGGTRVLSYSNAGHHHPVLIRGEKIIRMTDGGVPLGLFEGAGYSESRYQLESGDLLALFTDGIPETPNLNDEEFGERRLLELLVRHRDLPLQQLIDRVLAALSDWSDGVEAHDDTTLLLTRVQ